MQKNLLSIMLAVGLKSELQSFINDYGIPLVAAFLVLGVAFGIVKNLDLIVDKEGSGSRREGITNVVWIVGYVIVALAVLAGVVLLINSKLAITI